MTNAERTAIRKYKAAGCLLASRKGGVMVWDCPNGPPKDCGCSSKAKKRSKRATSRAS